MLHATSNLIVTNDNNRNYLIYIHIFIHCSNIVKHISYKIQIHTRALILCLYTVSPVVIVLHHISDLLQIFYKFGKILTLWVHTFFRKDLRRGYNIIIFQEVILSIRLTYVALNKIQGNATQYLPHLFLIICL